MFAISSPDEFLVICPMLYAIAMGQIITMIMLISCKHVLLCGLVADTLDNDHRPLLKLQPSLRMNFHCS